MTDKPTSTETYSVASVWSTVYAELKGGDWDEDVKEVVDGETDPKALAALAMKYAYDTIEAKPGGYTCGDDAVRAVLKATFEHHHNRSHLSPVEVAEMADNFQIRYAEFDEPLSEHLDEYYNNLSPDWLNERGRKQMESEIHKDSEIWLDENQVVDGLPGVWVFSKPSWAAS